MTGNLFTKNGVITQLARGAQVPPSAAAVLNRFDSCGLSSL